MGLIKAGIGAAGGVLADQWKEFFYCESMDKDVLVKKGSKRTGKRSSNTKGDENIISNGSVVAVADGQCMMIVEQGKVVEVCAEPGEFVFDTSTEPSIFAGNLDEGIDRTFEAIGKRFTFGGDTGKDQRVYYFNTKELVDNKFGTATPIPFRVVDTNIGLDVDVSVRCNGSYSYRIADPILFYTNVCGNVASEYRREEIDSQLKAEFLTALQPAFAKISELQIRPSAIPGHVLELADAMNEALTKKWSQLRGLEIVSVGVNQVTLPPEDSEMIKQAQRTAIMRDPSMAAATLTGAQADAMKMAASNENGAMMGFMGMGMAAQAGGMNAQSLFAMGQQQQAAQQTAPSPAPAQNSWKCSCGATATGKFCPECGAKKPEPVQAGAWKCKCGATATGKFCPECGSPKPADADGWTCSCGTVNKGKFCQNCGAKKPAGVPMYRCDKCGWEPEDPAHPPKFCPECGDVFDDNDMK
ncbi:SPFH domain-containing protein [Ruminococcus sp. 5_1_39BFAA]|uniref:SPFH domain-containing protein n=1 Tax=Ruminococcus sp. 5_1_39BFAA TaxID=457412 RepID=UPI0035691A1C